MRALAVALGIIILISCVATATAAGEERYGYIKIHEITIHLENDTAIINMDYTVDEGTRIIFFMLGRQDLKNKLYYILNYPDAQMRKIDLNSAEFTIDGAAYSYGKGIYWYPSHRFNVMIPSLVIQSPQVTKSFVMTDRFPDGIGYFDIRMQDPPVQPAN